MTCIICLNCNNLTNNCKLCNTMLCDICIELISDRDICFNCMSDDEEIIKKYNVFKNIRLQNIVKQYITLSKIIDISLNKKFKHLLLTDKRVPKQCLKCLTNNCDGRLDSYKCNKCFLTFCNNCLHIINDNEEHKCSQKLISNKNIDTIKYENSNSIKNIFIEYAKNDNNIETLFNTLKNHYEIIECYYYNNDNKVLEKILKSGNFKSLNNITCKLEIDKMSGDKYIVCLLIYNVDNCIKKENEIICENNSYIRPIKLMRYGLN